MTPTDCFNAAMDAGDWKTSAFALLAHPMSAFIGRQAAQDLAAIAFDGNTENVRIRLSVIGDVITHLEETSQDV